MLDRMRYGWTFQRGFYLVAGLVMSLLSFMHQEWYAVIFGLYFASMGLFGFGCAGGQCYTGSYTSRREEEKSV